MVSIRWNTSTDGPIEYISYNDKEHYDGVIEVLQKGFHKNKSVSKAIGLDTDVEAQSELVELVRHALKDGVSITAVEKSTGRIVGVAINKIQVKNAEAFFENFARTCKTERARELVNFMKEADDVCDLFEYCNIDCLLELMFLVVQPEFRNRKIGEDLTKTTIEVARKLSLGENVKVSLDDTDLTLEPVPKLVSALFTSPTSQRVGTKCGFEVAARINYNDLYFHGKSYASALEENVTNTALMFKRL